MHMTCAQPRELLKHVDDCLDAIAGEVTCARQGQSVYGNTAATRK